MGVAAALSVVAVLPAAAQSYTVSGTTGSVWINLAGTSAGVVPTGLPDANFTPGPINYNTADYTLGGFLNNPTFSNPSSQFTTAGGAGTSLGYLTGNTFFQIQGVVDLQPGTNSFTITHDDGVVLNITGFGTPLDNPGPTGPLPDIFTVTNTGSAVVAAPFTLDYVECCGGDAVLQFITATPQHAVPGPIPGTGLLSFAVLALAGGMASARRYLSI